MSPDPDGDFVGGRRGGGNGTPTQFLCGRSSGLLTKRWTLTRPETSPSDSLLRQMLHSRCVVVPLLTLLLQYFGSLYVRVPDLKQQLPVVNVTPGP